MSAAVSSPITGHAPPLGASPVGRASARGPREHQADAGAAHRTAAGRLAVAVADGVGDSPDAAFAARLVADHAVRVAALEGRPDTAVLATHDLLLSAGDLARGDAAAVVALAPGDGDPRWRLAWVGDCRALAWDGHTLRTLTSDQTVAACMRARGLHAHPRLDHVLTASARTLDPQEVGTAVVADPGVLLLVTDGVHRSVPAPALAAALVAGGSAQARADRVVALAVAAGTRDNATALVVDA